MLIYKPGNNAVISPEIDSQLVPSKTLTLRVVVSYNTWPIAEFPTAGIPEVITFSSLSCKASFWLNCN